MDLPLSQTYFGGFILTHFIFEMSPADSALEQQAQFGVQPLLCSPEAIGDDDLFKV